MPHDEDKMMAKRFWILKCLFCDKYCDEVGVAWTARATTENHASESNWSVVDGKGNDSSDP